MNFVFVSPTRFDPSKHHKPISADVHFKLPQKPSKKASKFDYGFLKKVRDSQKQPEKTTSAAVTSDLSHNNDKVIQGSTLAKDERRLVTMHKQKGLDGGEIPETHTHTHTHRDTIVDSNCPSPKAFRWRATQLNFSVPGRVDVALPLAFNFAIAQLMSDLGYQSELAQARGTKNMNRVWGEQPSMFRRHIEIQTRVVDGVSLCLLRFSKVCFFCSEICRRVLGFGKKLSVALRVALYVVRIRFLRSFVPAQKNERVTTKTHNSGV